MAIANSGRARILERIRKAHVALDPAIESTTVTLDQIYAPIADPLERFQRECAANLTEVHTTRDFPGSVQVMAELLAAVPPGSIYVQADPTLRRFVPAFAERQVLWSTTGRAPEDCQATITLCDGLVAQTGSILTSSRNGGRGGSIIAPTHIVYATSDQLVPDVTSALRTAMARGLTQASYFGLISGSSRTADIEKILVQGAHGPIKVCLILEISPV